MAAHLTCRAETVLTDSDSAYGMVANMCSNGSSGVMDVRGTESLDETGSAFGRKDGDVDWCQVEAGGLRNQA